MFMKKIINISLYKNERLELKVKNIPAIFDEKKCFFLMENVKTTISEELFSRETEEYLFKLDIKNKKCSYLLKEKNMTFDIDVEQAVFKKEENCTTLQYKISSDEEEFMIKINELEGETNE